MSEISITATEDIETGEKKVSLAKAADIAGISIREMLDILNEKGIPLHISQKSIMKDFEAAMQ